MDQPAHVIDPDGEVIIVLRNANAPFAEDTIADMLSQTLSEPSNDVQNHAEEIEASETYMEKLIVTSRKGKKKFKKSAARSIALHTSFEPIPEPIDESVEVPVEEPVEEPTETGFIGEPPDSERTSPHGGLIRENSDHNATQQYSCDEDLTERSFRIQVSAKHLTLASSVFKKILTGGWKENVTYLRNGSVEITAESWDIEALLILLKIMHCQHNHIPRKLTLEMLAKVAVLADYYECKEAVGFFADIWIKALEEKPPTTYSRDLILWLWISWFFELPDQFQETTSTAMSLSNSWINLGLPIPDKVLDSMNRHRQQAIHDIVLLLHEKQEALLSGSQGCDFECSSIMYGALTKQMQSNALLSPRPVAPFPNLNYKQLVQELLSFKSPQWYGLRSGYSSYSSTYRHICVDSSFASLFGVLNDSIEGLDLRSLMS